MRFSDKFKVKTHLAACALAAATFSGNALGAIVCASPELDVPNSIDGVYLNMVTGQSGTSVSGWDINPYNNSVGLTFYGTASPYGVLATGTAGTSAEAQALAAGDLISPTPAVGFYNQYQTRGAAFQSTGTRFLGVKFLNETTNAANYGWLQVTSGASTGFPATINRYCYENTGIAIKAGDDGTTQPEAEFGFNFGSLDFGNVTVGSSSAPLTATLSNVGDGLGTITALNTGNAAFAITGGTCGSTPFDLDPDDSCTIAVTFTPSNTGASAGSLTFSTGVETAVGGLATAVELSGNGVAADPGPGPGPGGIEPVVANVPVNAPWALAALLGLFGLIASAMLRRR